MPNESTTDVAPAAAAIDSRQKSYREILGSTCIIGGSAAINVCIGIVRTKLMAVLLGPAGYGVMSAFVLITDLVRGIAQMGLNGSGVQRIAAAAACDDSDGVARTAAVLRTTAILCGLLGAVALAWFSGPVAVLTFGDATHASSIALLSLAVFFSLISGTQGALLQGLRRVGDLARISVIGSLLGTVVGVPLVYYLGPEGLAITLVAIAACSALTSWCYTRGIKSAYGVGLRQLSAEASELLKLGFSFMASGLATMAAAYVVRIIVLRESGTEASGLYQAAWTLGGLYIGFILQALGTDFYPRLVGLARLNDAFNRLVNEQARISLLIAAPGVIATMTLAPFALYMLYSAEFAGAEHVLRWICLGMALRVLTWPVGFIVVAKSRRTLFFLIDLAWSVMNVFLTWLLVPLLGVDGAGVAFFLSYVFHGLVLYPIARRLSHFRWEAANIKAATACGGAIVVVFAGFHVLPGTVATALGLVVTLVSGWLSIRAIVDLVSPQNLPAPIARSLSLMGLSR